MGLCCAANPSSLKMLDWTSSLKFGHADRLGQLCHGFFCAIMLTEMLSW